MSNDKVITDKEMEKYKNNDTDKIRGIFEYLNNSRWNKYVSEDEEDIPFIKEEGDLKDDR